MIDKNFTLHITNIIFRNEFKTKRFFRVCFFSMLFMLFTSSFAYANITEDDLNKTYSDMCSREKTIPVLGKIIDNKESNFTISINKILPQPYGTTTSKLSQKETPFELQVDMKNTTYGISFNSKKNMEIGDYIIIALNSSNDNWTSDYPPFEVSSLDSSTLEFLPEDKKTNHAFAFENLIHSNGKIYDFSFVGNELHLKYTDANNKINEKRVFPNNGNNNIANEIIEENERTISSSTLTSVNSIHNYSSLYIYLLFIILAAFAVRALITINRKYKKQ